MRTLTDPDQIHAAEKGFEPDGQGVFPTHRKLNLPDAQEWAEHGEIDGQPVTVFWVFEGEAVATGDPNDFPWQQGPSRIEIRD